MGNNLKNGARNEKEKWNRALAVLLMMAMSISLKVQPVAVKVRKKKMQKPLQYIYGAQTCMKNMHHTSRNSFRIQANRY